jgi:transposase
MLEMKEILLAWLGGRTIKYIARNSGLGRNTVRRYIRAAEHEGLEPSAGPKGLTDEHLTRIVVHLDNRPQRERGDAWSMCQARLSFIEEHLASAVKLSKIHRLLRNQGVIIPYATLHRFAKEVLNFGQIKSTIPVADGQPGQELQVDTGWMTMLEADASQKRKKFKAWIFTASLSRHRFVYPIERETIQSAIAACEAAWQFFGGIFHVLIPDNTKAIVQTADPLHPRITEAFREYAIYRGFEIDTARVRHPKDKARVERAVQTVREDCFRGEKIRGIKEAITHAASWCTSYGMRRHTSTRRMPLEHFDSAEKPALLPMPTDEYDVPHWCEPKVAPDQHAQVQGALYSLPRKWIGKRLRARADSKNVCFYHECELVKTHPKTPSGGRSMDENDFPKEQFATAQRDLDFWRRRSVEHGEHVGRYAHALLEGKQPWTRLRRVFALLGLCKKYGNDNVNHACCRALDAGLLDMHRLRRMLEQTHPIPQENDIENKVIPLSRYLRPSEHFKSKSLHPEVKIP